MLVKEPLELEMVKSDASKLQTAVDDLPINDEASARRANELLIEVKRVSLVVQTEKEKITKPANEVLKSARALFKPVEDQIGYAEKVLKQGLVEFKDKMDSEALELQKKIEADKRIKRTDTLMKKLMEVKSLDSRLFGEHGTSTFSNKKVVRVVDPKAVPAEYWGIDMVALRRDVLGNKAQGIAPKLVPGVVVEEELTISTNV